MCTASKSKRSSAATQRGAARPRRSCASPGWPRRAGGTRARPGGRRRSSRCRARSPTPPGRAPRSRTRARACRAARRRTSRCRRSRRAGCAGCAARAAASSSRSCSASSSAANEHRQRVGDALARVVRAEERVPRVDERRAACPAFALLVAERHAAAVVHERRVVDEVAQADARRAEAEVDLLAVAAAERVLVEAARTDRARARVTYMQKPTPVITSGSSRSECSRTNAAHSSIRGFGALERERLDDRRGQRADRSVARQRRDRRDVGERRGRGEAVEPAVGHRGVGVEDHDVAGAPGAARG